MAAGERCVLEPRVAVLEEKAHRTDARLAILEATVKSISDERAEWRGRIAVIVALGALVGSAAASAAVQWLMG